MTTEDTNATSPTWLNWIEKCFRIKAKDGTFLKEVTGYVMDGCGRNPVNVTGSYLGAAILRSAMMAAGCQPKNPCVVRVFGAKPSSLLTIGSVFVGLSSAISMPIIGAIIDNTSCRKQVGSISAFFIVIIIGISISIGPNTWFAIYILYVIEGFLSILHVTTVYAYLPGFSTDSKQLSVYTSLANVKKACITIVFFALVTSVSIYRELNTIQTSRLASILATINAVIFFSYAWIFLFEAKPPLRSKPENTTLVCAGFQQLSSTIKKIFSTYKPLRCYILSLLWSPDAGSGTLQTILVTYMTVILRMTGIQIGIASFILFVFQIPGGYIANFISQKIDPLIGLQICLVGFAINSFLFPIVCHGPETQNYTYFFAISYGLTWGWLYPCQNVLYCTLAPKGQEVEVMGLFAFSNHVLSWAPSMIFSALNEAGVHMRMGIFVTGIFFLMSLFCTLFIGRHENAVNIIIKGQQSPKIDEEIAVADMPKNDLK